MMLENSEHHCVIGVNYHSLVVVYNFGQVIDYNKNIKLEIGRKFIGNTSLQIALRQRGAKFNNIYEDFMWHTPSQLIAGGCRINMDKQCVVVVNMCGEPIEDAQLYVEHLGTLDLWTGDKVNGDTCN